MRRTIGFVLIIQIVTLIHLTMCKEVWIGGLNPQAARQGQERQHALGEGCSDRPVGFPFAPSQAYARKNRTAKANATSQGAARIQLPMRHPQSMFRGAPARRGSTGFAIPKHLPKVIWRYETKRPIYGSPALDRKGSLYFGSLDGYFYSLNRQGILRWRRALGDRIYSSPAITERGIAVGADNDRVFLLSADRGAEIWSFPLGPCTNGAGAGLGPGPEKVRCDADSSVAVAPDGTLYLGGDALYALTPQGRLKWRFAINGHARSSPAVGHDGAIFIGSQGGAVYAVTPDGQLRWEFKAKFDFDSSPAITPDYTVITGCDNGYLYALSGQDGKVKWTLATRGPIASSPAVGPDGTIYVGSDDKQLYAIQKNGRLKWRFAAKGPIRSSPTVDPAGTVVFGSQDDRLYAVNSGGRLLWSLPLGGDVDSSVTVGPDSTLFVGADDGYLYVLR